MSTFSSPKTAASRGRPRLGVGDRIFTIDAFLEKVIAENPGLVDYRVLSVRKTLFGRVNLADSFFDSFRADYDGFDRWFTRKSEEPAYVCFDGDRLVAFLYLKVEDQREPYHDIFPAFQPMKRLKIGTFKVELNGFKIGERFLKVVFDNAVVQRVDEVYVTIFNRSVLQQRLIRLLEEFGFRLFGEKRNPYGTEAVYVRGMSLRFDPADPCSTFPYMSKAARVFLVPIYPEYHTELLPDSILKTESPLDFVEQQPHRNAIRKVYVSRSIFRELQSGDVIVFYRTGGYYRSVVTTLGIVEDVHLNIEDEEQFIRLCRQRSVFTDKELRKQWRWRPRNRPFIVDFLYAYSFPKRPNMEALIEHGVIRDVDSAPRGFEQITRTQFETILRLSETDPRVVVNYNRPEFVAAIMRGDKRYEFRRRMFRRPVDVVVIYATVPVRRVVAEFRVESIVSASPDELWRLTRRNAGVDRRRFIDYFHGMSVAYAIKIGAVREYRASFCPVERYGVRPPQSLCISTALTPTVSRLGGRLGTDRSAARAIP